jgi:hypothetical protein
LQLRRRTSGNVYTGIPEPLENFVGGMVESVAGQFVTESVDHGCVQFVVGEWL